MLEEEKVDMDARVAELERAIALSINQFKEGVAGLRAGKNVGETTPS